MKKKPDWVRKIESTSQDAKSLASDFSAKLKRVAVESRVAESAKRVAASGRKSAAALDERYAVAKNTELLREKSAETFAALAGSKSGRSVKSAAKRAADVFNKQVAKPVNDKIDSSGVGRQMRSAGQSTANAYGELRSFIKPYYAPDTPVELLQATRDELLYINACILQISTSEAERLANSLGKAVVSKIAGAASAGALLGAASLFGSASTGTAIGSLYGAAHANAALAWVGGLFSGGMATGAVVTGGTSIIVGAAIYKMLSSEARQFEELSSVEQRIVETTAFLIAAINEQLKDPDLRLLVEDAETLYRNTLIPLFGLIALNCDDIVDGLDAKNALAFRQHAVTDFQRSVLDGYDYFIKAEVKKRRQKHPEFAVAGVIYSLLTQSAVDGSEESQMALDAIRRVKSDWHDASEGELSIALAEYSPEQLQGIANSAKGIYHEMLFVRNYNASHSNSYAEMFEATNHPGADVVLRDCQTGEILGEYQLKATSNAQIIRQHFEKYPDIDVMATSEISKGFAGAADSGISNADITEHVTNTISDVSENTVADRTEEAAFFAGLGSAIQQSGRILRGESTAGDVASILAKNVGVAAGATAMASMLFGA